MTFELHGEHTPESAARVRELYNAHHDPDWRAGSAEPWIANVLAELVVANNTRTAVEIGGFQGFTSKRIARALGRLPHATEFMVCEIDPDRAAQVRNALFHIVRPSTRAQVIQADSHEWIPTLSPESVDFVWLDGNHEKRHVWREIRLLLPKLAPGGIICGHDVFGVCDLQEVFRVAAADCGWPSMSLDLPRLGPAGGIGILQRPR